MLRAKVDHAERAASKRKKKAARIGGSLQLPPKARCILWRRPDGW
jgi:hypothetical protein